MIQEGVQYVLRLKDYLSGAMPKVASAAQAAFAKVDAGAAKSEQKIAQVGNAANSTQRSLNRLSAPVKINLNGAKIVSVTAQATSAQKSINKLANPIKINLDATKIISATAQAEKLNATLQKVSNTSKNIIPNQGSSSSGKGFAGGIGIGALTRYAASLGLIAGITGGAVYSANAGLQGGAQEMSFQVLAGEQSGTQVYKDLTRFAQDSIFGNEVYKNAQTQLAFGGRADRIMRNAHMIGDVSMGDKNRLSSLNLAYSQVQAAGKLSGQDNLQFINAGFNPLQEISQKTGRSMAQLRKDMEDGKITFEMVDAAFVSATSAGGKFYRMTERIGETPFGKVQNFRGSLEGAGLQMGNIIAPKIADLLDKYGRPFMDFVSNTVIPHIGEFIDRTSRFMPIVEGIATEGYKLIKPVAKLITSEEISGLTAEFGTLTKSLITDLIPAVEVSAEALRLVAKVLKPIVGVINLGATAIHTDADLASAANGTKEFYANLRADQRRAFQRINSGLSGDAPVPFNPTTLLFGNKPYPARVNSAIPALSNDPSKKTASDFMSGAGASSASTDAITGGGRRVTNIYFNKEIVGTINQNITGGLKESTSEIRRIVSQELQEIAYSLGGTE